MENDHWATIVGESPNLGDQNNSNSSVEQELVDCLLVDIFLPSNSCTDQVDYITVETLGNAQDFGNLADARHAGGQCAIELVHYMQVVEDQALPVVLILPILLLPLLLVKLCR